ncbi:hypothetical protein GOBAR_AA09831 [Gossypium barbadense]|uniref:Uncharacterized protein n=1 Tax=Gossypium barbadense TaxID=3634 RepID=A0A2P5Y5C7_GOSBA|nr:hypothetical protein GOBAR_AA09831 [Gossypium barbadense]
MAEQQQEQQQSRSTGKVLWFDDQKGFGFIHPDDGGEDLFVHQSSIKSEGYRSLAEGESVEFTVSQGNGGKTQAVDVTAIGGSQISKKDRRTGGGGWRAGNDRRNGSGGCYNCGDLNHLARDCSNNVSSFENNDNYNNSAYNSGGGGSCYNCGEAGHFARECRRDAGGSAGETVAVAVAVEAEAALIVEGLGIWRGIVAITKDQNVINVARQGILRGSALT